MRDPDLVRGWLIALGAYGLLFVAKRKARPATGARLSRSVVSPRARTRS
jgi:hypothetical protein